MDELNGFSKKWIGLDANIKTPVQVHIKSKKATKVGKGRVEWVLFKVNEEIEDRCGGRKI